MSPDTKPLFFFRVRRKNDSLVVEKNLTRRQAVIRYNRMVRNLISNPDVMEVQWGIMR